MGKDNIHASKLVLSLWFRKPNLKTYATSFDMFTLYTLMLHLFFQERLPTTSFGQQWYFFAPWWWCWISVVLAWISMAMVNFSTWDYLWTRGFNIVPWSHSLLFNINNIFNCVSKRYIILNFYSLLLLGSTIILTFCVLPNLPSLLEAVNCCIPYVVGEAQGFRLEGFRVKEDTFSCSFVL